MKTPLVSVVIPTFNRSALVVRAVQNVIDQTYANTEIIVVDDGSTDDTARRLEHYQDRITVIRQKNAGPSAARNRGIEIARGEIVAFQDSDDIWVPHKLERQVHLLEILGHGIPCCLANISMHFMRRPCTTSFALASLRPQFSEGVWENVPEVLGATPILFNQAVAVRAGALKAIGGFNEGLRIMEDYDLSLRLALYGPAWAFVSEPLGIWQEGSPDSLSQQGRADESWILQSALDIRSKALTFDGRLSTNSIQERILVREINRNRRELAIVRMRQSSHFCATLLGDTLTHIERYRRAIYRRSPSYPRARFRAARDAAAALVTN